MNEIELMARTEALISAEPRTQFIGENDSLRQLIFVQRSRIFRFPDTIWIKAVDHRSDTAILIYSRSSYGYWDLGANRRRVHRWLLKLKENINN